jgi:hypothetical protein
MTRRRAFALAVALLVPLQTAGHAARAAGVAAKNAPVFQSSFKTKGIKKWTTLGSTVWKVNGKGNLTFDGSSVSSIFAPVSVTKLHDFRLEVKMKLTGGTGKDGTGFALTVRSNHSSPGIAGGIFYSSAGGFGVNEPQLIWDDQSVGGKATTVSAGFNTFRIDVHGEDTTFLINGLEVVQFSIHTLNVGSSVGVLSEDLPVQIKSLTVTKLKAANALPAVPPLQTINLSSSEVPSTLSSSEGHYITSDELAQLSGQPPAGFILGHVAGFANLSAQPGSTGPMAIFSYIDADASIEVAQGDDTGNWGFGKQQWSACKNFSAEDLSGLGSEAHVMTADFSSTGDCTGSDVAGTLIGVYFQQGAYAVAIFEDFVLGSTARADAVSQTEALAAIVEKRIPSQ